MNNRELAIGVFKHPLIQEILKQKLAESSIVNKLIVEEILNELTQPLEQLKQNINLSLKKNPGLTWQHWAKPAKKELKDDDLWTSLATELDKYFTETKQALDNQEKLTLYIDAYRKRLADANVSDYNVSDRAKAATSLALTPLTIFKVALGKIKDIGTLVSGKDPIDLGATIIRDLMTKKENEVLDKLEAAAKEDPQDIPQIISALFPEKINNAKLRLNWLGNATLPVLESQLISTGFMEEADLEAIANAAAEEVKKQADEEPSGGDDASDDASDDAPGGASDDATDDAEEEELPPSSPVSEEKKKEFEGAKAIFIKWFLRVPFLQDQQKLLVNLLDALDFSKGEKARIGKPEGETSGPPADVSEVLREENEVAPLRTSLRRVDNTLRTLNTSLKFYLHGGRSTKKGSSRYKNQIVESIKELQELIERSYNYLNDFNPTLEEEVEIDHSKDEDAISAVELAYEEARVALGDITTALEGGKNVGQLVALASVVQDILKPILVYYPKTAAFTQTAGMSARDAFEELQEVIKTFHSKTLVPLYIQLKDNSLTAADIQKGKDGLVYLATNLENLLGVSNPISDPEDIDPAAPSHTSTPLDSDSDELDGFDDDVIDVEVEDEPDDDDEPEEAFISELNGIVEWLEQKKPADPAQVDKFLSLLYDFIEPIGIEKFFHKHTTLEDGARTDQWLPLLDLNQKESADASNGETVIRVEYDKWTEKKTKNYDFGYSISRFGPKFLQNIGLSMDDGIFSLKQIADRLKPGADVTEQLIRKLIPIIENVL